MSEKTERPTQKKLRDGRKEGRVIKSTEITSLVQLATIFLYFHYFIMGIMQSATGLILLTARSITKPFVYALPQLVYALWKWLAVSLMYFFGGILIATLVSMLSQVGWLIASKAVGFKSEHINPVGNFKQIFSLHSIVELLKSSFKALFLCLMVYFIFHFYASTFRVLAYCELSCAFPVFSYLIKLLWLGLMVFYVLLSILDYSFQHHHMMKEQRMSKEDIKQERKDTEGDPHVKQRQREIQSEIQSGSLAQSVKQSAVVIRNPTHIAICLGYNPTTMPIPRVLEKSMGNIALHIVSLAEQNSIPVVENMNLARALYADVARGDKIPETLFEPVAALLRLVLQIDYSHSVDE